MVFSALSFPDLGPQRAMLECEVPLSPCGIKGEKNYLFLQTVKKMGTIIILRQLSVLYLHITSSLTARKIDTLLYNV